MTVAGFNARAKQACEIDEICQYKVPASSLKSAVNTKNLATNYSWLEDRKQISISSNIPDTEHQKREPIWPKVIERINAEKMNNQQKIKRTFGKIDYDKLLKQFSSSSDSDSSDLDSSFDSYDYSSDSFTTTLNGTTTIVTTEYDTTCLSHSQTDDITPYDIFDTTKNSTAFDFSTTNSPKKQSTVDTTRPTMLTSSTNSTVKTNTTFNSSSCTDNQGYSLSESESFFSGSPVKTKSRMTTISLPQSTNSASVTGCSTMTSAFTGTTMTTQTNDESIDFESLLEEEDFETEFSV